MTITINKYWLKNIYIYIYLYIVIYIHIYTYIVLFSLHFYSKTKHHYLVGVCLFVFLLRNTLQKFEKSLQSWMKQPIYFFPKNGEKKSANLNLLLFKKLATCRTKKQGKLTPIFFLSLAKDSYVLLSVICFLRLCLSSYYKNGWVFSTTVSLKCFFFLILVFAKQTSTTKTFMRAYANFFFFSTYKNL